MFKVTEIMPLQQLHAINPTLSSEGCFFAAIEGAKVLWRHVKHIEQTAPVDVSQLDYKKAGICKELIKQYRQDKSTINDANALFTHLAGVPNHAIMIVENAEGDHAFNLYKTNTGKVLLIDCDRNVIFSVSNAADLIHRIPGWQDNTQEIKFDYLHCAIVPHDEEVVSLKISTISDNILKHEWTQNEYLVKPQSQLDDESGFEDFKKYGYDD